MKKVLVVITACFSLAVGNLYAQNTSANDSASRKSRTINESQQVNEEENTESVKSENHKTSKLKSHNNEGFRDDSTDAAVGMSGLSTTPGVSTTTGAGGLGTNENTGGNTSSDIYNIERKDSIRKAQKKQKTKTE